MRADWALRATPPESGLTPPEEEPSVSKGVSGGRASLWDEGARPEFFIFGFDISEAAQVRRVRGVQATGAGVASAMMRRNNMTPSFTPDWPSLVLADVENERLGKRVVTLVRAIARMLRHRRLLDGRDVIVARNFDLLVVAWASRALTGHRRTPLVYECLDIHGLFTGAGAAGRVARWFERRLLARSAAVVVSSPGFVRNYFGPVQGYAGPVVLLENKLWFDGPPLPRPAAPRVRAPDEPFVLGWVGSIRCAPSLALLMGAADALGPKLRIVISGNVHRHAVPDFDAAIAQRPNVTYTGPYAYPDGLPAVYGACDAVWAQDLWQSGANSDWLLPNRIYEASYFGCPSIAVAGTETGARVAADGLGATVAAPTVEALVAVLAATGIEGFRAHARALLAADETRFRLVPEDYVRAFAPILRRAG